MNIDDPSTSIQGCSFHCMLTIVNTGQVEGNVVSQIGHGLVCLIGMEQGDTDADSEYMYVFALNCAFLSNATTSGSTVLGRFST